MSATAGPTGPGPGAGRCQCFAARGNGAFCGKPSAHVTGAAPRSACRVHATLCGSEKSVTAIVCGWAPEKLESDRDVYRMCAAYWDRDDPCDSGDGFAELIEVLTHIFTLDRLRQMARDWKVTGHWRAAKIKKDKIAYWVLLNMKELWYMSENGDAISALSRLQRRWRARRARSASEGLRGPYPNTPAVNDCDPFTLDPLCEIPADQLFSFRDSRGRVYAFRAAELAHYLKESAPEAVNPYTREHIGSADVARLRKVMDQCRAAAAGAGAGASSSGCGGAGGSGGDCSRLTNLDELWLTGRDAFSYTLYFFEREGFYCDVDAFLNLTSEDIANVFAFFNEATRNSPAAVGLMREDAWIAAYDGPSEGRLKRMQFAFCKELLEVVRPQRERKFWLLCNLFISIAAVSVAVSRSLPEWARSGAGMEDLPRAMRGARAAQTRVYMQLLGDLYRAR